MVLDGFVCDEKGCQVVKVLLGAMYVNRQILTTKRVEHSQEESFVFGTCVTLFYTRKFFCNGTLQWYISILKDV